MARGGNPTIVGSYPRAFPAEARTDSIAGYRAVRLGVPLSWAVVGAIGALEGVYGRTQYVGDWISYLNVSRAVSVHDWKEIFNPMWNPGYPALVALVRSLFPDTAVGEWHSITLLNWIIFLFAYQCWRSLIRRVIEFYKPELVGAWDSPLVLWLSCCAFLSCMLCLNKVSDVSPDLLVTALFILAVAQTLTLLTRTSRGRAAMLGLVFGVGCWAKGAFIAFAGIFLLTVAIAVGVRRVSFRAFAIVVLVFLVVFLPMVAGMSWSYGQFTYGVSGPLNYAFHVNHLPHWTNWQGGSSQFGTPLHRTTQLVNGLPVFGFGTPFRTTYAPYNNLAYWYRGSHRFFIFQIQAKALGRTLYFSAAIVRANPFLWALALSLLTLLLRREWRASATAIARRDWPIFLPAVLGIGTYLAVHVEDRYLSPFCLICSLLPLLALLNPTLRRKRFLAAVLILFYTAGAAAELKRVDGRVFGAAIHPANFHRDPQWRLAAALPAYGLRPGDAVAVIHANDLSYRVHWAYIAQLRIVAEFGGLPWRVAPWDRTRFDSRAPEAADENYGVWFREKLTAEQRAQVMQAFRDTGAKAVVALSRPAPIPGPGWQPILGTGAWIYRLK